MPLPCMAVLDEIQATAGPPKHSGSREVVIFGKRTRQCISTVDAALG